MTASLADLPAGVTASFDLVATLDDALVVGLGRLGDERLAELAGFAAAFASTPIATRVADALAGLARGVLDDEAVLNLAMARRSIMGAIHDALRVHALGVLGFDPGPAPAGTATGIVLDAEQEGPLTGARLWLGELALNGFAQMSGDALMPFAASLERLAAHPELRRASAILTGFHSELVESLPLQDRGDVPDRRWADLWSAAVLATRGPVEPERTAVKAVLTPLGADVRHHDRVIACNIWAIADITGADQQIVTVPFMAWKVDALSGQDSLRALPAPAKTLLGSLTKKTSVECSGQLSNDGTLVVTSDDVCTAGAKVDPLKAFAEAESSAIWPIHAAERHPIHIALPVQGEIISESGSQDEDAPEAMFVIEGGETLPLASERISPLLTAKAGTIADASTAIGLLRFDGHWEVQPLAAKVGRGLWGIGEVATAAAKPAKATEAGGVLRERASRLLRS